MGAPKFSEWRVVGTNGEIPEELLPCGFLQYRWALVYIWPPDEWGWGISGGLFKMQGDMAIGEHLVSHDEVTFVCTCLGLGGVVDLWTYYPGTIKTTGPESCPVWDGADMWWEYDPAFGSSGFGIGELFIVGWLNSPIYKVRLYPGAIIDPRRWRLQYAIEGTWALEVRTAPGIGPEGIMVIDHPNGNRIDFRLIDGLLLCRQWLSAYNHYSGPVTGMRLMAGVGLEAMVTAGRGYFGGGCAKLLQDTGVTLRASKKNYVWAAPGSLGTDHQPAVEIVATVGDEIPEGGAYLLGTVVCGAVTAGKISEDLQGSVVAFDVDNYGADGGRDGVLRVSIDQGSDRRIPMESRDGGLTWE